MKKTIPFATSIVSAGFPSPAEDLVFNQLDLNEFMIEHPAATFFVRVGGDSMIDCGIFDGDILVVDRSLNANTGDIIIAAVNNELTVKRYIHEANQITLVPENKKYKKIKIDSESDFKVWGIVTSTIHKFK